MNGFAFLDIFPDHVENGRNLGLSLLNLLVYIFLKPFQLVGDSRVQGYHCAGTVGFGPYGTEFETVSGECER